MDLNQFIEEIPDFPKPGILFKDISPLLKDPDSWERVMGELSEICKQIKPDLILGIEARGFIVGSALATHMKIGFIPIRKKGKLAGNVYSFKYSLEYGEDTLEIKQNALINQQRVLLVDDLLATGGTAHAAAKLISKAGGNLCGYAFIIELSKLKGREKIGKEAPIYSLLSY